MDRHGDRNCFYRVTVIITKGDTEARRKAARGSACYLGRDFIHGPPQRLLATTVH